jgi:signal transduction histidine kinase
MQRKTVFLACFFICTISIAQQYSYVHYTPKDGLVNSRVRKAYQDSRGRMYFLTFGGLSVYDGARFKNYTTLDGLGSDLVNDIIEAGEDSILIATNTGILNTLVKGKISRVNTENNFCPTINYFYRHNNQSIYLSCDQGLFQLEGNRIRPLNIFPLTKDSAGLAFLGAITGSGHYLFLCTDGLKGFEGLYLYDIRKDRICDSLLGKNIYPSGKNKFGQVWISFPGKNFVVDSVALSRGKLNLISPPSQTDFSVSSFTALVLDNNNKWMFYAGNPFSDMENRSIPEVPVPDEIKSSDIRYLFVDRENTIWVCSNASGVFKMVQSPLQILENPPGKNLTIPIYAVYYSPPAVWYSSNKEFLYKIQGKEGKEFRTNLNPAPAVFFVHNDKVLGNDAANVYEAAVNQAENTLSFKKIISLPDTTYFTSRRMVDPYDAIIAGVKGGLGVWKNNQLIFFSGLTQFDLVEGLLLDKNYWLWMITRYSGIKVFRLHPENPAHYLEIIYQFSESQIAGSPRCMEFDKTGNLWIGTRERGLFKYKTEINQLKELAHFTTGNGLTDNFVVSLACDSSNNILAGTQTGLDRIVSRSDGSYQVENLTKTKNYFGYISDIWVHADGQGYARTFSGSLLLIRPYQQSTGHYVPQLLLEEIRVNASGIAERKSFSYKENNLSFWVAAPSFIDEKQVKYSYLLEGSGNNQWSDTSFGNSVINLTNLAAGTYTLNIKAFFPSSMYQPAAISYFFEIAPPWWQTWWFRLAIGVLGIGTLVLAFRFYYNRKLEREKAVLEKQQAIEKERTRIATDMHDDLGAGLSRIKFLSETMGIKKQQQQPIEEDISKIRDYSHEMIDKMGEIVWALNEKNDTLSDLLSYTRAYSVHYLSENGITCTINLPDFIPAVFVSGEFRRNIYLTVKEALHNVVKHAQASAVSIDISTNGNLQINITDNGTGFDKSNSKPFSNGLTNMEKRITELGGVIEIIIAEGTRVQFRVPLPA